MNAISRRETIYCILEYIKKHKKECLTEDKTYFLSKEKMAEIIKERISHTAWYEFDREKLPKEEEEKTVNDKVQDCIKVLRSNDSYEITEDGIKVKAPLWKAVVENKHSVVVQTIKNNAIEAIFISAISACTLGAVAAVGFFIYDSHSETINYPNSKFVTDSGQYNLSDIYVVYNVDNTYFCTRDLVKVTEADSVNGNFSMGNGKVGEYYYRDDIYDYYDVKTGNKICQDHEDGFYIEKLTDFYNMHSMRDRKYSISISEVENEINNDYLLSRNPGIRRK